MIYLAYIAEPELYCRRVLQLYPVKSHAWTLSWDFPILGAARSYDVQPYVSSRAVSPAHPVSVSRVGRAGSLVHTIFILLCFH